MKSKESKKPESAGSESQPLSQVIVIESVDQLSEILKETLYCKFDFRGRRLSVPVTPLSPATAEAVRDLRRRALPPFKRERGPNGSHDELDPKYLKDRDENDKKARSLIIYTHCPAVAAKQPGLTSADEIHKFVQTLFTETILEMISLTIQEGGISLEERTDFTSAGTSES